MRDLVKQLHFDTSDDGNGDGNKIDDRMVSGEAGLEYTRKTHSEKMTKKQIVGESYLKTTLETTHTHSSHTVNYRSDTSDTSLSSDDLNTKLRRKLDLKRRMTSELDALEEEIKNLKFQLEENKSKQ